MPRPDAFAASKRHIRYRRPRGLGGLREDYSAQRPFRFIHASVKEYLSESDTRGKDRGPSFKGVVFLPSPSVANALLATTLVGYLTERLPQQQLSDGQRIQTVRKELRSKYPLISYAASYWTIHLNETQLDTKNPWPAKEYTSLISALNELIATPKAIMVWIEVCYILGNDIGYTPLLSWSIKLTKSQSWLSSIRSLARDTGELGKCLGKIVREWDNHLSATPSCIWEEIGSFFPSKFLAEEPGHGSQAPSNSRTVKFGSQQWTNQQNLTSYP